MMRRGFFKSIAGAVAGLVASKVNPGATWTAEAMRGAYPARLMFTRDRLTVERFAAMPYRNKWLGAGGQAMETAAVNGHAEPEPSGGGGRLGF